VAKWPPALKMYVFSVLIACKLPLHIEANEIFQTSRRTSDYDANEIL